MFWGLLDILKELASESEALTCKMATEGGLYAVVAELSRPATKVTATKTRSRPAPTEKGCYYYPSR
jgi:hypothetical protein